MYRNDLDLHYKDCKYLPIQCQWCKRNIPQQNENVSNILTPKYTTSKLDTRLDMYMSILGMNVVYMTVCIVSGTAPKW